MTVSTFGAASVIWCWLSQNTFHLSFDLIQSTYDMLNHVASVVVEWDGRGDIFVTLRAECNGLLSASVS